MYYILKYMGKYVFNRFMNYQQEGQQYPKGAAPGFTTLINPSQLPQPPIHWQPPNRNCKFI